MQAKSMSADSPVLKSSLCCLKPYEWLDDVVRTSMHAYTLIVLILDKLYDITCKQQG